MYYLKYSSRFKKDLKIFRHDKGLLETLEKVLDILATGDSLPKKYQNHPLRGEFRGCFECHLQPDVLLVYKKDKSDIYVLVLRIGSHSDLF